MKRMSKDALLLTMQTRTMRIELMPMKKERRVSRVGRVDCRAAESPPNQEAVQVGWTCAESDRGGSTKIRLARGHLRRLVDVMESVCALERKTVMLLAVLCAANPKSDCLSLCDLRRHRQGTQPLPWI